MCKNVFYFYSDVMETKEKKKIIYIGGRNGLSNWTFGKKVHDNQLAMTVLDFVCGPVVVTTVHRLKDHVLNQEKQKRHLIFYFPLFLQSSMKQQAN